MNNLELVRLLAKLQDALDELDRHNVGNARRAVFEVARDVREAVNNSNPDRHL